MRDEVRRAFELLVFAPFHRGDADIDSGAKRPQSGCVLRLASFDEPQPSRTTSLASP